MDRIKWIDTAKAICIILVVFMHVADGCERAGLDIEIISFVNTFINSISMSAFVLLSGYFFIHSYNKYNRYKSFFRNKASTIIYPYLIWSLIQAIVLFVMNNYQNTPSDNRLSILLLCFLPQNQMWFLLAIFIMSIVSFILLKLFGFKDIIITCVLSVVYYFIDLNVGAFWDKVIKYFIYYNLGIGLSLNIRRYIDFQKKNFVWMLISIVFLFLILLYSHIETGLTLNIATFIGLFLLLKLSSSKIFQSNVINARFGC